MSKPRMELLFTREEIASQVRRLGAEISRDFGEQEILLVGVLKGSCLFLADLARAIQSPVQIDFVRLASYGSESESSGLVEMRKDIELPVADRNVIIVEDIIDSGYTLEVLFHRLSRRGPRSLKVCTLLDKRSRRAVSVPLDYVGLVLDDGFVIGYGLDYDERFRNLPEIFVLNEV